MHFDTQSLWGVALKRAIEMAWDHVPEDFLKNCYESVPERARDVINKGGGPTKW